ncbi:large ribosomal subunit protein uL30m [Danio rerio]|uniref:Large ribosomal subunit protein uL30m n=2 Tax=Danio TaxID=7954 RepID=Q502J9_DANRE|nr:39S ribosomal protein L30, mitochondrial [Danio rerio]AAH95668.1 Zgc:112089 [Danio rerio]|eukprot:NP_001018597.1 39S ribosomal protein L30, mitochondrial [Danio rerio]
MAGLYRALLTSASNVSKNLTQVSPCRTKFTKSRISPQVFEERAKEHDKYGGDPEQPHKLHIVTRVKSTMRRPYWEKKVVKSLGLMKSHEPRVHKNTPSVNNLLKIIKHLVRIEPLKLPHGLPAEEDMANTHLNSRGELVVKRLLKPLEKKAIES